LKTQREMAELQEMIREYQKDGTNMSERDLEAL
jgi:uncharacterized membrane protein (DUF106 family)